MLTQMTRRLVKSETFEQAIQTILDDVIALHGAQFGNIQLAVGDELRIAAQRGFALEFLEAFWRVRQDDGSACGQALRSRETVVVPDVKKDREYAPFRKAAKAAGYRAVQSTPFLTKDGKLLGLVSTHFAQVHRPTRIEMETLQKYSVVAAEYIWMLLGEIPLAAKAKQMSEELYASMLSKGTLLSQPALLDGSRRAKPSRAAAAA